MGTGAPSPLALQPLPPPPPPPPPGRRRAVGGEGARSRWGARADPGLAPPRRLAPWLVALSPGSPGLGLDGVPLE